MTNGSPAPNQTTGISSSPTAGGSISWTDITPGDPTANLNWIALAINADNSLMAASDGTVFSTSATEGAGWTTLPGVGTASVAISTLKALGPGPGVYPAGIPADWEGVDYRTITAAGAQYLAYPNPPFPAAPQVPSPPLNSLIIQWAQTYGFDPDAFARQLYRESKFCPNVREVDPHGHPAGQGIAQWTRPYPNGYVIAPFDPTSAISAAARYIAQNRSALHGNLGLAFAAYNSGLGSVLLWLADGQPESFPWDAAQTPTYVLNITGRTIWEWAADGIKLIAANAGTSNIAVSNSSGGSWVDQLPQPGALPKASVAIAGNGVDAVAGTGSTLWTARSL